MKQFKFIINGNKYEVKVEELEQNHAEVVVNGTHFTVELEHEQKKTPSVVPPTMNRSSKKTSAPVAVPASSSTILNAQLPGSILKIMVKEGQEVKKGEVLLTMESMKMENNIMAEYDGVVKSIFVQPAANVMQGDRLMEIISTASEVPVVAEESVKETPKSAPVSTGAEQLKSPLPGSIVKVLVKDGDAVTFGDTLLIMESMKMENNIKADRDCVIKKVYISEGQTVMQDDLLVDIE